VIPLSNVSVVVIGSLNLNGKCTKLHTVATSNNRDNLTRSLYYCLFVLHIYGCYSFHTSRLWWIAHSTQRILRGCNNIPSFLQRTAPTTKCFTDKSQQKMTEMSQRKKNSTWVLFFAHNPVSGESHIQCNANREVATVSMNKICMNPSCIILCQKKQIACGFAWV